ncbi:hypothetical protein Tco_0471628 [Tanacetum coccineum]
MVISSPCLTDKKELASPKQTALGKDISNPLIVDSLLKTIWFINAPCFCNKALAIPGQTTTGKELSNPLMADSLPKTILSTKISKIDWLLSSEVLFEGRPIMSICSQAMNGGICYIKSMLKESKHLGISKEVGILRYLSLVVPLTKVGDEAVHKELGDRMEKAATTASSL